VFLISLLIVDETCKAVKVRGYKSGHLYTTTYRETRTAAVYNIKWRTDPH